MQNHVHRIMVHDGYYFIENSVINAVILLHLALQPWVSLGFLDNQSPLLSALQPWVSLGLLYSQFPLLLALQPWVSLGLLDNQFPLLLALQPPG
jgi:hypothetical protein